MWSFESILDVDSVLLRAVFFLWGAEAPHLSERRAIMKSKIEVVFVVTAEDVSIVLEWDYYPLYWCSIQRNIDCLMITMNDGSERQLTVDLIQEGFCQYVKNPVSNDIVEMIDHQLRIDWDTIDDTVINAVLQYALFGKIQFPIEGEQVLMTTDVVISTCVTLDDVATLVETAVTSGCCDDWLKDVDIGDARSKYIDEHIRKGGAITFTTFKDGTFPVDIGTIAKVLDDYIKEPDANCVLVDSKLMCNIADLEEEIIEMLMKRVVAVNVNGEKDL